jgi:hypothetical protein
MCESSVYVKHRRATNRERLTLKSISRGNYMGFYPTFSRSTDPKLVCIREAIQINVSGVAIRPDFNEKGNKKMAQAIASVAGQTLKLWFVPANRPYEGWKSVTNWYDFQYVDGLIIGNLRIPLFMLVEGMTAEIGERPARRAKGMVMVEASMREALALPPDPKPEGEAADAPSSEPPPAQVNPVKEAEKEPVPAGDAPASRRQ